MLNIIPIDIIDISNDEPPYDKNGNVIPVVGIVPVTTRMFRITWRIIPNDNPNVTYL